MGAGRGVLSHGNLKPAVGPRWWGESVESWGKFTPARPFLRFSGAPFWVRPGLGGRIGGDQFLSGIGLAAYGIALGLVEVGAMAGGEALLMGPGAGLGLPAQKGCSRWHGGAIG